MFPFKRPTPSLSRDEGLGVLSPAQAGAALRSFLHALGHDPADFELEVDAESQLSELLGLDDRMVTVRRVSNGTERLYAAGRHSSWLAELLLDIEGGCFGKIDTPEA
jgi:hypothetical protein